MNKEIILFNYLSIIKLDNNNYTAQNLAANLFVKIDSNSLISIIIFNEYNQIVVCHSKVSLRKQTLTK